MDFVGIMLIIFQIIMILLGIFALFVVFFIAVGVIRGLLSKKDKR